MAVWEDSIFVKSYVMMITDVFVFHSVYLCPEILITLKFCQNCFPKLVHCIDVTELLLYI